MRTRAMERDNLHGPWPTMIEMVQADYPDWEIWRDQDEGRHGDWHARRGEHTLTEPTAQALRERLEAVS